MKLKKIASLMLAGIMAVSMLAACGSNTPDSNNNGGASSNTTSTGLSAEVLKLSSLKDVKIVSARDSVMLQDAVDAAAAIKPNWTSVTNSDLIEVNKADKASLMTAAVKSKMGSNAVCSWEVSDWKTELNPSAKNDGNTQYSVYYVSAQLSDEAIAKLVANKLDAIAGQMTFTNPANGETYDYEVSVAMADWIVGKDADASKDGVIVGLAVTLNYNEVEFN